MVEMGVGEQEKVDAGGVEAEVAGVLLLDLARALIEAAIDQQPLARAFQQMTGAGDAPVGAVEREPHEFLLPSMTQLWERRSFARDLRGVKFRRE